MYNSDTFPAHGFSLRNKLLDGLRGYAALAVLVFHSILMLSNYIVTDVLYTPIYQIKENYYKITKFFLLLFNGHTAVNIFFVLSGMVLFTTLLKSKRGQLPIITFSLRRIIRIYLPLIPCLSAFYLVFNCLHYFLPTIYPHIKFHPFVQNCFLYKITLHGASWTLQSEIWAIPLILFTFYGYKKWGTKIVLILTSLSILIIDNDFKINFHAANTWVYYFYLGFCCAIFPEQLKNGIKKIGWFLPLFTLVFVRGFFIHSSITANLLQGFSIAILILYLSSDPEDKFSSFLKLPFSQYLGKISFSLYLWNVMVLNLFLPLARFTFVQLHPLEFGILIAVCVFIVTLPLAHFSEKFIEQPAIRLGKNLSNFIIGESIPKLSRAALLLGNGYLFNWRRKTIPGIHPIP
ncbi:O-acetyltransferase [Legionella quinlivanii]|uniref:O-acetyltransferase n=1 Tax=Legionella quinlivanii TaxID=45073 RepID=A0A0W0Y4G2_9GAMM|nr:acyltransferase [Legionella quinlivanii]KTD51869.1 O-acetyltransferase [Legionella quinlivanii]SEF83386.1 Peptidoglycan/LPS O-acetylase OafA/YrhL, contains acyltransferase and SGNH-hydrolase domains [Legionella quinlivanii DSM 21216]STY09670.1 O-acetyltransferase [Legionella quinlivanii]